jgi:hypothetical protein
MSHRGRQLGGWSAAIFVVFVFSLVPIVWIVMLSLKTPATATDGSFIPHQWTLSNYSDIFAAHRPPRLPGQAGDPRGRPRRDASGRAAAGRSSVAAVRAPEQPVRRGVHRLAVDELRCRIPAELRRPLDSGPGGGRKGVIAGLRPEDFEDVSLVAYRADGVAFKAKIDVLESMGSEFYGYFVVASERVSSSELEELARDAGAADLPSPQDGIQVTARLGAESKLRQGEEAELWFDSRHLHLFDPESGRSLRLPEGSEETAQVRTVGAAEGAS